MEIPTSAVNQEARQRAEDAAVSTLVDQYAGTEASHNLYSHWRGGYYYAARPKEDRSAPLALLYVSR